MDNNKNNSQFSILNSQLKKGYKKTEIGVIPEEWEVVKLKYLVDKFVNGGTPSTHKKEYWKGNVPWITGADILNQKVGLVRRYITKEAIQNSSTNVIKKGKLLFVSRTGVGKLAIAPFDIAISQDFTGIYNNKELLSVFYLFWFLNFSQRELLSQNQGTSIQGITREVLSSIQIPLSSLPEQKAIATVLSDTDKLIQTLEKKIAKKQLIKKGAMQKLLAPKEGWVTKKLGDFLIYEQPTKYIVRSTKYNNNYDIPVLTAGKSFILGYTNEKDGIFTNYPVIIFDDFTTASKYVNFSFKVKSSAMKILKPKNEDVNLRFIYEIMQQIEFPLGDHKRYWIGEFQHLEIKVPKTKYEQTRIAQILSDMDTEIEALQKKWAKYKQLKQGLMQVLLTGKIRLV